MQFVNRSNLRVSLQFNSDFFYFLEIKFLCDENRQMGFLVCPKINVLKVDLWVGPIL